MTGVTPGGTIGCEALPRDGVAWQGVVSACFERTVILRGAGAFVVVGDASVSPHPCAVTLPGPLPRPALQAPARLTVGALELAGLEPIALDRLERFTPPFQAPVLAPGARIKGALDETRRAAAALPFRGGFHALLSPAVEVGSDAEAAIATLARGHVEALRQALRGADGAALLAACRGLAGLGTGLTPSGDDYVAGLAAAIRFHGESAGAPRRRLPQALAEAVAPGTCEYSTFLVRCAARGLVSRPVGEWLVAVVSGQLGAVAAATEEVARTGHSSGVDMLAGLVEGIQAAVEER